MTTNAMFAIICVALFFLTFGCALWSRSNNRKAQAAWEDLRIGRERAREILAAAHPYPKCEKCGFDFAHVGPNKWDHSYCRAADR